MGTSVEITKNIFARKGVDVGTEKGMTVVCIKTVNQAKALTPIDYGQLRNSIMYKVEKKQGGFNNSNGEQAPEDQKISVKNESKKFKIVGIVGTNSDHWYPEFGTRYQIAQPFLRPAVDIEVRGASGTETMKKYGKEQMAIEFAKRKTERKIING